MIEIDGYLAAPARILFPIDLCYSNHTYFNELLAGDMIKINFALSIASELCVCQFLTG